MLHPILCQQQPQMKTAGHAGCSRGSAFGTGFLLRSRAKSALGLTGLNGLFIFDFLFFDLSLLQHVVNNCIFQD